MNALIRLLLFIILPLVIVLGALYSVNNGDLNEYLESGFKFYLKSQGIDAKFTDFSFKNGNLTITKTRFSVGTGSAQIDNIHIENSLTWNWFDTCWNTKFAQATISVRDENNELWLSAKLASNMSLNLIGAGKDHDWKIQSIKISKIKDINNSLLKTGSAHFRYNNLGVNPTLDASLNFGKYTYLNIANIGQGEQKLQMNIANIPLFFYKLADKILPESELFVFLHNFVKAGHVTQGSAVIDPDKASLVGEFKIQKLEINYDDNLPNLKKMDVDLAVNGTKIIFNINKSYSSDILISDGVVEMDWVGQDDTIITVSAKGYGSAKGLTDFISDEQHAVMAKANIDLRKIKGVVCADIDLTIPLKPHSLNRYNITADIPNSSLDVFKKYVRLRGAKLSGLFDGDQVTLTGTGKINGFNSDINFIYNLRDESEFSHKLDIKTRFKTRPKKDGINQKIAFISLLEGNSILDVQYVNKQSRGFIYVDSDITNLDLYFDKLGIRKKKGDSSRIIVNGVFEDPTQGVLDFSVKSKAGLRVSGDVAINNNNVKANIAEIKSKATNLSAKISLQQDFFKANIKGKILDLSEADMLQFLEKERDGGGSEIRLNVDRVKLKDDIWLDDLKLKFECDNTRCFSGYIDSKIGSRSIEMLLMADGDQEEWLIKSSNAGALLRGIGAYDSMRAGDLTLNIKTSRKEVKSGQIIPILNGTFEFERFVLHDASTMTKLISIASLPGVLSVITGSKDIVFSGMSGDFSFTNNVLTIRNSSAEGPYFDFSLRGDIDTKSRMLDIKGHVTPALYGISSIVGAIPLIGTIIIGNKKRSGIMSAPYKLKEKY